jgi:hypothetical protein
VEVLSSDHESDHSQLEDSAVSAEKVGNTNFAIPDTVDLHEEDQQEAANKSAKTSAADLRSSKDPNLPGGKEEDSTLASDGESDVEDLAPGLRLVIDSAFPLSKEFLQEQRDVEDAIAIRLANNERDDALSHSAIAAEIQREGELRKEKVGMPTGLVKGDGDGRRGTLRVKPGRPDFYQPPEEPEPKTTKVKTTKVKVPKTKKANKPPLPYSQLH